jgi:2-polyprenyl-6-methoxyphenol hydroxylase-like FAD-dependent oxidoreductase
MRVVIAGGGMAGLVLARGIAGRGGSAVVLERAPEGRSVDGPIMLPFQSYDALDEIGVLEPVRAAGIDVPPLRAGRPVAISVARQTVLGVLRRGVDIRWEHEVVDLARDDGRVVGVRVRHDGREQLIPSDLVVGADGTASRVRELAGIPAELRVADTAFVSWRSPVPGPEPFSIAFLSDGRQLTVLNWRDGSAGGWQIDRPEGGAAAALAPGLDAYRAAFTRLLPQAEAPLAALTSVDQLGYREVTEVRCEQWWRPGVALIGEALHAMNPEVGIGSGLGMGDAQALAVAIAQQPQDPDAACRAYEHWRRPAIAPYLAFGGTASKVYATGRRPEEERWPPA